MVRCAWCNQFREEDETVCLDTGDIICNTCREGEGNYFQQCRMCNTWVGGYDLCRRCRRNYITCRDCGQVVHVNRANHRLCESCLENYIHCRHCDCLMRRSDTINGMCERCYGRYIIREYNYRPELTFHGKGPLYFGVELEVECPTHENRLSLANGLLDSIEDEGMYWLMSDGSLDYGYEIATHPCSLDFHRGEFPWKNILHYLVGSGHTSEEPGTCGLHVHMSKLALTVTEQMKIQYFVHNQYPLMFTLARRNGGEYTKFLNKSLCTQDLPLDTPDRHEAVNLSNHSTVEIRIFRGTLDFDKIMAAIEICYALVEYARGTNFNMLKRQNAARTRFISQIIDQRKVYKFLPHYMASLGIV